MGRMEKLKGYLSDVAVELKKMSFPTRDQTIGSSVVVVVMVVFMSFFWLWRILFLQRSSD